MGSPKTTLRASLRVVAEGDWRLRLKPAVGRQTWMTEAPALLAVAGSVGRTATRYGGRARRYVRMEAGAVAENVYLQATSLGLGTVLVGAFDDAGVAAALELERGEEPLALMPIGHR